MIGKHKEVIKELEGRSEVKVKVKVQRVSTCVELVTETSSKGQEVRMVPKRDAGIYVLGGTSKRDEWNVHLSTVERYDVAENRWERVASMNHQRCGVASTVLGGKIYAVAGGCGRPLNSVRSGQIMSCHVMSCQVMSGHVMSCHVMSGYVMSSQIMSDQVMSDHVRSCQITADLACHVMSGHVGSCHVMSCHVMSCNVM
eukprot:g79177.t1